MHGLIDKKIAFDVAQIKCIMRQLLNAMLYIHSKNVMHRDIKGANILMDNKGNVKVTDFGLAKEFEPHRLINYTNRVVTPWYRCPELLLGAEKYTSAVDMWSVGCFFAELLTSRALFPGNTEAKILELIFEKCGTPTEETWPGVSKLRLFNEFAGRKRSYRRIRDEFKGNAKYTGA